MLLPPAGPRPGAERARRPPSGRCVRWAAAGHTSSASFSPHGCGSPPDEHHLQPTGPGNRAAAARGHARPRERSGAENKGPSAVPRSPAARLGGREGPGPPPSPSRGRRAGTKRLLTFRAAGAVGAPAATRLPPPARPPAGPPPPLRAPPLPPRPPEMAAPACPQPPRPVPRPPAQPTAPVRRYPAKPSRPHLTPPAAVAAAVGSLAPGIAPPWPPTTPPPIGQTL